MNIDLPDSPPPPPQRRYRHLPAQQAIELEWDLSYDDLSDDEFDSILRHNSATRGAPPPVTDFVTSPPPLDGRATSPSVDGHASKLPPCEREAEMAGGTFTLGRTYGIGRNHSFNALDKWMYPTYLPGMAHILLKLRSTGCPLNVLDDVMRIMEHELMLGRFDRLRLPRSRSSLNMIENLFPVAHPLTVSVPMERFPSEIKDDVYPTPTSFPVFDFLRQLQDLLDADEFMNLDNLCVNPDSRWQPFTTSADSDPSELQSGRWYQNIVSNLTLLPYEFLIGLVFNVDKTASTGDAFQRHSAEPLMFTLSIFNEGCRRKPHLWKCLGFLPMPKKVKYHSDIKLRHYHAALDRMLSGLVECQENPPLARVRIGDEFRYVKAKFCVVNIIADGLGNEALTGRKQSRRDGCNRLCRACHTPTASCTLVNRPCKFLCQYAIEKLTISGFGPPADEAEHTTFHRYVSSQDKKSQACFRRLLNHRMKICQGVLHRVFSSHLVDNAFYKLYYGPNPRGIFGATPTDMMHAFEEGVVQYFLNTVINPLEDSKQKVLDDIANDFFSGNNNRGSGRENYPRVSFSGRFTSLTLLSADEKMGKLVLLYLISKTEKGYDILLDRCDPGFDDKKEKRTKRFKGSEDDDVGEGQEVVIVQAFNNVDDDATTENQAKAGYSKVEYDESKHRTFVDQELQRLNLEFLLDWCHDTFNESDASTVREIVWEARRASIKKEQKRDGSKRKQRTAYRTKEGDLMLPSDTNPDPTWHGCCDRRPSPHTPRPPTTGPMSSQDGVYCDQSDTALLPKLSEKEASVSVDCNVDKLISLMEMMLSFHAFYKYHPHPITVPNFFKNVRIMMSKLKRYVGRGKGTMGWRISKFHELLHIFEDTSNFGSPRNYDASKTEKGLQQWVKKPSSTVAKRGGHKFSGHLAESLKEYLSIQKACALLPISLQANGRDKEETQSIGEKEPTEATTKAHNFQLCLENPSSPYSVRVTNLHGKKHKKQDDHLDKDLIKWLQGIECIQDGSFIYSEVILKSGSLLRATPNYGGTGPWYDWVTYLREVGDHGETIECPFKVLGFYKDSNQKVFGFGKSADWKSIKRNHSDALLLPWKLLSRYQILDLETVLRPRVFALHSPRNSKRQATGAAVGNMYPWPGHVQQVQKTKLLDDEILVFTERLFWEDDMAAKVACWPTVFAERKW